MKNLVNKIYPHYISYSDNLELISFSSLHEFFKDFSMFPDFLNLIQLKTMFFSLHEIVCEQIDNFTNEFEKKIINEIKNNKKLNFNSFMDALLLTSDFIKGNQEQNNIEKLIYLVERMSNSQGVTKSQLKSGKLL